MREYLTVTTAAGNDYGLHVVESSVFLANTVKNYRSASQVVCKQSLSVCPQGREQALPREVREAQVPCPVDLHNLRSGMRISVTLENGSYILIGR